MNYLILWLNIFIVYTYTLFPTISAYRDAGEMVTSAKVLAIAHPPGYPLYILLTNIFIKILPIGNYAYRVNIFSALVSSLSSVLFYHILRKIVFDSEEKNVYKEIIIYLATLIFAFNYLQWYLSLVAEMYTLNIFFVVLILYTYLTKKSQSLFLMFFIFGISLANRLDIVLMGAFIFFGLILFLSILGFLVIYLFKVPNREDYVIGVIAGIISGYIILVYDKLILTNIVSSKPKKKKN
jgi:hypothetical protein